MYETYHRVTCDALELHSVRFRTIRAYSGLLKKGDFERLIRGKRTQGIYGVLKQGFAPPFFISQPVESDIISTEQVLIIVKVNLFRLLWALNACVYYYEFILSR